MAAPAIGGSIIGVTIKNRPFVVAADGDAGRDPGGWKNEVQSNGDGSARLIKTRKPWQIDGLSLQIADGQADLEFLQSVADMLDWVDMTVTEASGLTYQGKGTIAGDIKRSSQNATGDITFSGPGRLLQQ